MMLDEYDGDPTRFIVAGDRYASADVLEEPIHVLTRSDGYDGQFMYRLAMDPFTNVRSAYGIRLDNPRYRQQRILYPLLAWMLSLGDAQRLPWILIGINMFALCALGWLAGVWTQSVGRHAFLGLMFPLYPGALLVLARDTTEILELLLIMACFVAISRTRYLLAAILLLLAVLAKETALGVVVAACVYLAIKRRAAPRGAWLLAAVPLAGYSLWQLWLSSVWGQDGWALNSKAFGVPEKAGAAFWDLFTGDLPEGPLFSSHRLGQLQLVLGFAVLSAAALWRSRSSLLTKLSLLGYGAMLLLLGKPWWIEDWTFLRVFSEFYLFGMMLLLAFPLRMHVLLFLGVLFAWREMAEQVI